MFVDHATIEVHAGNGGDGFVSFRRARHQPKGGPDGGDGGDGGSIILEVDEGLNTLIDFRGIRHWKAQHGEPGSANNCHGKTGQDKVIRVPPGTVVIDNQTQKVLADLGPHQSAVIARGGRGGLGNDHFKSSTNQAPRTSEPGEPGERKVLRLELKLIADAGLVGMPNAGKSTLLSAMTRADAKTGNYPFTTITPQLGVLELDPRRRIVLADLPGLIEGASEGAGLGHQFLQHIERTRAIVHLVDPLPPDGIDPLEHYKTIREELGSYSQALVEKPELIVLTKADLLESPEQGEELIREFRRALRPAVDAQVVLISAATGQGLPELREKLWSLVHAAGLAPGGWNG